LGVSREVDVKGVHESRPPRGSNPSSQYGGLHGFRYTFRDFELSIAHQKGGRDERFLHGRETCDSHVL
jgi:hypothetical protein